MFYNCCGLKFKSKNLTCYSTYLKPAVDESGRYRFSFIYHKTYWFLIKAMIPRKIVIVSLCVLVIASVLVSSGIIYHQKCQADQPLDVEQVDIQMIPAGDIEIAYKELGTGDPLLLIMGWAGTMDLWNPSVVNTLAAHYRVIIFDNRGMGELNGNRRKFYHRTLCRWHSELHGCAWLGAYTYTWLVYGHPNRAGTYLRLFKKLF